MIRRYCDACGILIPETERLLARADSAVYCNNCESCGDWPPIGAAYLAGKAEAFWSAIAHERAEADRQREAERAERTSAAMRIMTGGPVISANELLASLKLDPTIPINTTPVLQTFIKAEKGKV